MKKIFLFIAGLIFLFPITLLADDIDIYGVTSITDIKPNILIMFDNSGSMATRDVSGDPYDPATTYSGSYSTNSVYYWNRGRWRTFANDINSLNCSSIVDSLQTTGAAQGNINAGNRNFSCGGSNRTLRLGNFLNYDQNGAGLQRRIDVAKEVVTDLINTRYSDVNFGLMIFNYSEGGKIAAEIGASKQTLINAINDLSPDTWTPLAETLSEAGLYFAGKDSWFNNGVSYTSPVTERCQKNYIIIMTDGEPTYDDNTKLVNTNYINGKKIGDADDDGNDPGSYANRGTDYLDDVAKFLFDNDLRPDLGEENDTFETQNVITHTIGFTIDHPLLEETAKNGGGNYYTSNNISSLSIALGDIIGNIISANAVYVAPVVPVSRYNRTFADNKMYVGFFQPNDSGRWAGNLKKYRLGENGVIYDAKDNEATDANSVILPGARSFWTTQTRNDGQDVKQGGAVDPLQDIIDDGDRRNIYTYTGTAATTLSNAANHFKITADNSFLTKEMLGVATNDEKDVLIENTRGLQIGDIIHSEPAVVHYYNLTPNKTYIFIGSNDGMLHCFDDDDGSELWAIILPDQLGDLSMLYDANHNYYVDGSPTVYYGENNTKHLIIGERRGGSYYTVLDITQIDAPKFLYSITPDILNMGGSYEALGQSWIKPMAITVSTGLSNKDPVKNDVFLLAGGYDINQDLTSPNSSDSTGRAVFAVDIDTGTLVSGLNFNAVDNPSLGMTHSIVDIVALDHYGDGVYSRIYAPDLGGKIFTFKDDEPDENDPGIILIDGSWDAHKLFDASHDGVQRKIFYAPDVATESFGDFIFFGTGDRADPNRTDVVNYFFAVKNTWSDAGSNPATMDRTDLVNVTDNLIEFGTDEQKTAYKTLLDEGNGWYFELEHAGEKVVSTPVTFNGTVLFTTYTPPGTSAADTTDPCGASTVRGVSRLYAVDYKTGASSKLLSDIMGSGNRSKIIGTAIPSAPVIAIGSDGAHLYVGIEGGVWTPEEDVSSGREYNLFYWRQIFE